MICLDLYGIPVPQKRPQFSTAGDYVHCYDGQKKLKESWQWQIKSQFRNKPIEGPLSVDLIFHMPVPKSISAIKKKQMLNGIMYHMGRPDIDNLQKFILDCLNQTIIMDDAQIVEIRAKKVYSERPGTYVKIIPMNQTRSA
jgi:Holliday junction resolvase RusA-like endonuclease